jgi:tricorn protease
MNPSWAPDSKWIAYTKKLKNQLRAVFVYSLESGATNQITDGLSDAISAQFDRDGKYLYFAASTNTALTPSWLDMTSQLGQVTRSVYLAVLNKADPSPFAPESDEEKDTGEKKPDEKKTPVSVRVDFENIGQRILAVPMPARNYIRLVAGKAGQLFVLEQVSGSPGRTVHKFDLKTRKTDKMLDGAAAFEISANGEKILYRQGDRWFIAGSATAPKPGEGALKVDAAEVRIDPRAEWKQMFRETWRIQRDWFYDPKLHGLNIDAQMKRFSPYLDRVTHRSELSYLFQQMLSDITVGHLYIRGGDIPEVTGPKTGLLGADYSVENGRFRFARIYNGENWNPDLRAPLTQPGVNVSAGDYLLAVNGRDVTPAVDVHSYFEATAGRQTLLKVGPDPSGANAREVTVVPVDSETGLRTFAWIEDNRRKVHQLSNGRLAYVYLPDTGSGGFTYFNRYYFSQVDKEGAVLDERFNGGGQAADYIIDFLWRPLMNYWSTRYGEDFTTPRGAIFGPKAMIVNEFAGSGGDALPWYFRRLKIGPLIGKRTWGSLVGILGFPTLMDGGTVTAPNVAFWSPEGRWEVENAGVSPDIEVDLEPKAWREGRDTQLEKAVEVVMAELQKTPAPKSVRPAYPVYNK